MARILIWAIIFLVIGGYMIKTAYDLDFNEKDDQKNFIVRFISWVRHLFGNAKEITGLVVEQDWKPVTNETNSTR